MLMLASRPSIRSAAIGSSPRLVLREHMTVGLARARCAAAGVPGAPVVADDGSYRGVVTAESLEAADETTAVGALVIDSPTVSADDGLDDALGVLADHRLSWVPVLDAGRLLGVLSARDIMTAYRRALAGSVRQVRGVAAGGVLLEADLGPSSNLVGRSIADVPWPRDVIVVAIERDGRLVVPRGGIVFEVGDRVSLFAASTSAEAARVLLGSDVAAEVPEAPAG